MSGVSQLIMQLSFIAGVVSLILVLLPAFAAVLLANCIDAARSLIFGSTLFVCTIASYLVCKDSGLALDCEGNEIVIGTPQLDSAAFNGNRAN